jgi:predicted nucleic acid-binding protein
MIYCDTAYLLKYYVPESGSEEVTCLIDESDAVASVTLARLELTAAFHRKLREGVIDKEGFQALITQLDSDNQKGIWNWLEISAELVAKACTHYALLSPKVFIRASDALHLTCAREHGFKTIYSNDTHLLTAAKHFGLRGKNVLK